jgi:hypothetical protein
MHRHTAELIEVAHDNANNLPEDMARVRARIARGGESSSYLFIMRRQEYGAKRGCWLTQQLLPSDSKYIQ